ncbi:hypothetical protein RJ640_019530 [Escallonia rubra]|uniref:Uncharacterized protein n=1 Tax=Escallonia rubra TaxID=112253 RepID=A0AA88R153_9ASTE|nr:hypothetical protein RJ640_019530 [Escallonia rubra]
MASMLAFSGSTNFLMNLPILLSILTYLAPSFSSSRFLSPLITKTLSSSTCTLISPDFSPGMSIMNTYEFGYSFTSAGVAAMALASRNFNLTKAWDVGDNEFIVWVEEEEEEDSGKGGVNRVEVNHTESLNRNAKQNLTQITIPNAKFIIIPIPSKAFSDRKANYTLLADHSPPDENSINRDEKPSILSSNLDFNRLGLLGLRRRQLLDGHRQHPVLTDCRNCLDVGILRQHELPHELADPPLHPHVLGSLLLFLPLPLPAYHQDAVVLHLHLDITRFQPRHVDYERVGIRVLLYIGGCRSHGLGVAKVGLGRGVRGGLVVVVHHVV